MALEHRRLVQVVEVAQAAAMAAAKMVELTVEVVPALIIDMVEVEAA